MSTKKTISNSFVVNTIEDGIDGKDGKDGKDGIDGKDGKDGERGKVGRFFYYAGNFDSANNEKKFLVNDAQAPFFRHKNEGTEIYSYYVFNREVNGEYTMSKMWEESVSSFNNKPWEIMTNDFKYLITEALFSENAHLGSAIIKGDWMISQHGKINGNHSEAFTAFNPDFPNSNNANSTNFIPNYAVDLRTGVSYQNEAYLTGSLFANSIQTNFVEIQASTTMEDENFILGVDHETGEVKNMGCWNFIIKHPTKSSSFKRIVLPTNKYLYAGQRVIIYNPAKGTSGSGNENDGLVSIAPYEVFHNDVDGTYFTDNLNSILTGVAERKIGSTGYPLPINSYTPIQQLDFYNGVVELMCVPIRGDLDKPDVANGLKCEWCVVNIGTNLYELKENKDEF